MRKIQATWAWKVSGKTAPNYLLMVGKELCLRIFWTTLLSLLSREGRLARRSITLHKCTPRKELRHSEGRAWISDGLARCSCLCIVGLVLLLCMCGVGAKVQRGGPVELSLGVDHVGASLFLPPPHALTLFFFIPSILFEYII